MLRYRTRGSACALTTLLLLLGAFGWTGRAAAQSDVTTIRVTGTVEDAQKSPLPGVTVEATNQETGLKVPAVTDAKGLYRILDLPTGVYTVAAALDGFHPSQIQNLRILLGTTPVVNFTLQPASVAESITVTSEAPVVETTNTTFSTTIQQEQIKNLPVLGRDFKNLATLAPETTIEGQRGNIAIGGERGINTSTMVDGVDYNNAFFGGSAGIAEGRAPLSLSQESIKEFNVITNGASVEFGRSGAGFVNVITKSGTNKFHGAGFYYNQPQSLISNFADGSKPRDQKKDEYGATIGGPIVKDKLFFFLSYDKQDQHITFPYDPTLLNPAIFAKYPELAPSGTDFVQTRNGSALFGRLDYQLGASQRFYLRGNNPIYNGQNGTFNSTNGTDNGNEKNNAKMFVGSYTAQVNANILNDFNANYITENTPRLDRGLNQPQIGVLSPSIFYGEVSFLPITSVDKRKEAADTVTYLAGAHVLKGGVDYNDTSIDQIFKGNWRGVFTFANPADLIAGRWLQYRQFGGLNGLTADQAGKANFAQKEIGVFAQDQWFVRPDLTMTLGLRWEGLHNPKFPILNPNDRNANGTFNLTAKVPDDNKQFSPRLGLSWAPDTKTAVRFSAGRYWSRTPALLFAQTLTSNGVRGTQYSISAQTDANGNVIGPPTDPLSPGWGSGFVVDGVGRIDLSHATKIAAPGVFTVAPNYKNAHSDRVSLGAEREVCPKIVAGIDLVYAEDKNLERLTDLNLALDGTTSVNGLPHYGSKRPDPAYGSITEYVSDGRSRYEAATFHVQRRFADRFSFYGAVTWSKDRDNDSNERNFAGIQAEDVNNLDLNYAFSDRDIRWKTVLNGVWQSPFWGIGLAGAFHYYTGTPYTPSIGFDANGDRQFNDRPTVNGVHLGRNSFRNPATYDLDFRLSKSFDLGPGQITPLAECFNCTNAANRSTSRTTFGKGPTPSSSFGVLNNFTATPRTFQLALRYDF
ncbi:MAG: TonB-dependent receptor [Acidobacteriota bacterium]|nr:TonB-dependent receptor [Acidobacteriota bacterium]